MGAGLDLWVSLLKTMRYPSFSAVIAAFRGEKFLSYFIFVLLQALCWVEKEAEVRLEMSYLRCVPHLYRVEIKIMSCSLQTAT